jgi:hypothetical protein
MAEQPENPERRISTRFDRADWSAFGATSLLTFVGYLLTLSPGLDLAWSGILTTGAMYGGVGPPAGYPAWTIYSWLFIKLLPFSNPAWRVAVGSAFAGAIACGLVALMVSRSGKMLFESIPSFERISASERNWIRGISGYVAGMALGFSDSFWNVALVANFWTFTVLLFTIIIYLLMRWKETGRRRFCWLGFFIDGLLLTDSQEMITALLGIVCAILLIDRKFGRDLGLIALPVVIFVTSITQYAIWDSQTIDWPLFAAYAMAILLSVVAIVLTKSFGSQWKSALACTLCFLFGFALYLYLPIASATNPPVNWAYSRTLNGFIHLISRGQFEHAHPANSLSVVAPELWRMLIQTGGEFGWLYVGFAVLPFFCLMRSNDSARKWMAALFLISVCVGPLLAVILNAPSDRQSQGLIESYFFPLRVPLAIWTGMGLIFFAAKMATLGPLASRRPI